MLFQVGQVRRAPHDAPRTLAPAQYVSHDQRIILPKDLGLRLCTRGRFPSAAAVQPPLARVGVKCDAGHLEHHRSRGGMQVNPWSLS